MTTQYKMLSDGFLTRFRGFMAAENRNPQGAFDSALPTKGKSQMSKRYRFVPVAGTANALFTRERMAADEVSHLTDMAQEVLNFLHDKLSDNDMARVEEMLKMEAGVKTDSEEESDKLRAGAKARGAQDSSLSSFAQRFPGSKHIRPDDMIGRR
jgi:hypothetical protein